MRRAGGLLLLGLAVGGVVALAVRDVESRRIAHAERAARALAGRAEVARRLFASEDARLVSELARVRVELRDQALWPGLEGLLDESGRLDTRGVGGRRLHALLSQALEQDDRLVGFDLVVAGHGGLVSLRFPDEGGVDGRPGADSEGTDPARLREGRAKALWYGDEVSRAVASNGRAVERGEVGFEGAGDVERAMLGMAIGLHAPGELVQGALRARIDVGRIAAGFERLAGPGDALAVVLLDGRRVDAAGRLPGSAPDPRLAAWAARVAGPTAGESSFEDEGRLVHASPLTTADGGIAHLLLLQETPSAATGAAAWLASPWPIVLAVLVGVALVASALMLRPASAAGTVAGSAGVGADDGIRVAPRDFVLREWLADVRGCLEREAATRGLVLDLRCERSLPSELVQDPAWLGGLIVAMGREALDATTLDGVTLEVAEEQGRALCFELHAGEARLSPVAGMQEVAERIGARLESRRGGRMALVLPGALA